VRAVNKAGASAPAGSGQSHISDPPPNPSLSITARRAASVPGCPSGCYQALVRFNDIQAGDYDLYMEWEHNWVGNKQDVDGVSSGDTVWTSSGTGLLASNNRMRVRAEGPSGTVVSPWLDRQDWINYG
jgi:hypothetical protein